MRTVFHKKRTLTLIAILAVCAVSLSACSLPSAITNPCDATSTLTVTKTEDTNDGVCSDTDCSLREAIITSNTCTGTQTIKIPPGTYKLTRLGADEQLADTGDLNITSSVVIQGSGANSTIIDGNLTDRIFDIKTGQAVFMSGLTLQNGKTPQYGSAIANQGNLTIDHVIVQKNSQTDPKGTGGAIFSYDQGSSLEISNSAVVNNIAAAGVAGLYNVSGNMNIENVTLSGNTGYAVGNVGGQTAIKFSTLAGDNADYEIWNSFNGQAVAISNSILASPSKNGNCMQPVSSGGFNLDNSPGGTLHSCGLNGSNDLVGVDPKLQALGDNGGHTLTMALDPSSAAVESANLATCSTTDQRDVTRPQGSSCDRGAFELENPPARPTATPRPIPTRPPQPTPTPRPAAVGQPHDPNETTFTFQVSGNCREGPDKGFKSINPFQSGQTVVVLGQNSDGTWLEIKVPASTLVCWVSKEIGSLNGTGGIGIIVQAPTLPQAPDSFADTNSCDSVNSQRTVVLTWVRDPYADGYYIYRKNKLIHTVAGHEMSFTDQPPYLNDFQYQIVAFNSYGVSPAATLTVLGCPSP